MRITLIYQIYAHVLALCVVLADMDRIGVERTISFVYLLENAESVDPVVRKEDETHTLLGERTALVIVCGHSHFPRAASHRSSQLVVNPGSGWGGSSL
jgi:predicted phosphodiesterase